MLAAELLRATSFVIDGEGVIVKADGSSDFDRLHSRRHDREVHLLGFDLLELDGADLREQPLETRKATLASLLRRSHCGIQFVEHIEAADGASRTCAYSTVGCRQINVLAKKLALHYLLKLDAQAVAARRGASCSATRMRLGSTMPRRSRSAAWAGSVLSAL